MRWTPEQIDTFLTMRAAGRSYAEVAKATGKPLGAVQGYNRDRIRREKRLIGRAVVRPVAISVSLTDSEATEQLRCAVLTAIVRHANDNLITVDEAARNLLSLGLWKSDGERLVSHVQAGA
jgi:hypothetical protein